MSVDLAQHSSLTFSTTSISAQPRPKTVISTLYNDFSLSLPGPLGHSPSHDTPILREDSPSSTMTVRRSDASHRTPALVDATDMSVVQPPHTLHRRSSRLSRWLLELETATQPDVLDLSDVHPVGTLSNPYLAYPHLSMAAVRRNLDDADSMHDYVVVNEDIALECPPEAPLCDQPSHVSSPTDIATPRSTIRLINPSQSLRHFHLPGRSVSPSPKTTPSRSPSRLSVFPRPSRGDLTSGITCSPLHSRSMSLQTSLPRNVPKISSAPRASSWRLRPSVLGHFSSASVSDTDPRLSPGDTLTDRSRSRPSISSSNTCSSVTTPTTMSVHEDGEAYIPSPSPSKSPSFFGSLRVRSQTGGMVSQPHFKSDNISASSPPLRQLYPASVPHLPERQMGLPSSPKAGSIRLPFTKSRHNQTGSLDQILIEEPDDSQPRVLFGGKPGAPRLSLSSLGGPTWQAKKRKLVVSGIALNDTRRLDAIQKWCQSFGEVDQITRMPNGDLQINFQRAEVAETVCRVRAKVHIAGAGSVHLSWITGNKRT